MLELTIGAAVILVAYASAALWLERRTRGRAEDWLQEGNMRRW